MGRHGRAGLFDCTGKCGESSRGPNSELVATRLDGARAEKIDIEQGKGYVWMVMFSQPGKESAYDQMERPGLERAQRRLIWTALEQQSRYGKSPSLRRRRHKKVPRKDFAVLALTARARSGAERRRRSTQTSLRHAVPGWSKAIKRECRAI